MEPESVSLHVEQQSTDASSNESTGLASTDHSSYSSDPPESFQETEAEYDLRTVFIGDISASTRAVHRPQPRSSHSCPATFAPSLRPRRSIPCFSFQSINCFDSRDAFETDIDVIQAKWEREAAGIGGIEVFVTQSQEREYEALVGPSFSGSSDGWQSGR